MTTKTYTEKHLALAKHLQLKVDDLDDIVMDHENSYFYGNYNFFVYTDEEATQACYEYIEENLWGTNSCFITDFLDLPSEIAPFFAKACEELCEGANPFFIKLLGNRLGEFCEQAVNCDGRGHFLAFYDFEENECDGFFIYKN